MGRISLLGTGNVAFSGNEIYSTNNNAILFGSNITPATSAFSIGTIGQPFNDLYLAANSLSLASNVLGASAIKMSNDGNSFTVQNGGLRSQIIYTGGLLLSGNNVGADPAVGTLPMNIGTNGLPAVNFLAPLSAQSSTYLSNTSATNLNVAGKGFIQTFSTGFRVVSGTGTTTVTALSVDFLNDSFVHCHSNGSGGSLTITPINIQYGAGRKIDVLVFNPIGGTLQIITNSVASRNTTYGASFILDSSPSQIAHLSYMCVDGTLDNTFISAVYK